MMFFMHGLLFFCDFMHICNLLQKNAHKPYLLFMNLKLFFLLKIEFHIFRESIKHFLFVTINFIFIPSQTIIRFICHDFSNLLLCYFPFLCNNAMLKKESITNPLLFLFSGTKKGAKNISGPSKVLAKPGGNTESHVPKIQ